MQVRAGTITCLGGLLLFVCTALPAAAQPCPLDEMAKLTAPDAADYDQFGNSVALDGDVAVVGTHHDEVAGLTEAGSASVFRRIANQWRFEARLTRPGAAAYDHFGQAVAVSGDRILVGADLADVTGPFSDDGAAELYRFDGSAWVHEATLTASDANAFSSFGSSVAIDGDAALVGAPYADGAGAFSLTGAAYLFRYDGSIWSEEAILTASDGEYADAFGGAVDLDGDLAIVGAAFAEAAGGPFDAGAAYLFRDVGSSWSQEAIVTASDGAGSDRFGTAVAVDGGRVAVGAPLEDDEAAFLYDRGAVYLYQLDGGGWSEVAKQVASDALGGEQLGGAVALDGDWAAAGARYVWPGGAVYLYHRLPQSGPWAEEAKLFASDALGGEELGGAVAIDGPTVLAGAPFVTLDGPLYSAGAAYVFGPLSDCDADGTLDHCQTDCNLNGISDACELAAGTVEDDNVNGVPDVCECGCIDLFFLIDNTGTMGDAISTIQAELPQLVARARTRSVDDLRLGLIRFGDRVDVLHDLTFDVDAVLTSLANIGLVGGSELPEPSDAALQELFEKNVALECLEDATAQYPEELDPAIDFRPGCLKIAVLLTDALPTGCEDGPPSQADLDNALRQAQNAAAAGVQIFAIYPPNPVDFVNGDIHGEPLPTAVQIRAIMQQYADLSGGIFAEVEHDATGLLDAVLAGLERCIDCNDNDVSDFTDIGSGTSLDTNGDTRPDECEHGACCISECEGEGDPAVVLLACLSGEIPFLLSCQGTTRSLCDAVNQRNPLAFGTFQGHGSTCATAGCGGACCTAVGCESSRDEAACVAQGGSYQGNGTSCGQTGICGLGGCCYDGGYACDEEVSYAACEIDYEGDWLGPDTVCDFNDSCFGACCTLDGEQTLCQQASRYVCEEVLAGHFSGEGTSCEAEDFTGCFGACCLEHESCDVMSFELCTQEAGGVFAGPGTACVEGDLCPDYGGCWIAGSCEVRSRQGCLDAGGSYLGAGRACGENCAPPPGSCLGDFDLDGDIDEDDLQWYYDNEEYSSFCTYGVGDCDCDRFDLCQAQVYDPECSINYLQERLGTLCP